MSKTILTVDDSPSVRQMVGLTLMKGGFQIIEAGDGRAGLATFAGNTVNMVITDLNMPNMDGIEMIRQIRALPSGRYVPIVMLTTESQAEKKQAGKAAGASGWIVKPFTPEQLVAVVNKLIR